MDRILYEYKCTYFDSLRKFSKKPKFIMQDITDVYLVNSIGLLRGYFDKEYNNEKGTIVCMV